MDLPTDYGLVEGAHRSPPPGLLRLSGRDEQAPGWPACLHAAGALPVVGVELLAELSAMSEVTFHVGPQGPGDGARWCRPQVVDIGLETSSMRTMALPSSHSRLPGTRSAPGTPCTR